MISVGVSLNTATPVPVSSVTAALKLADEGVPRKVATLAARPETPDEIGRPVQLVSVPEAGVPRTGVTRVGDVANTRAPDPVSSVTAEARLAEEGVSRNTVTPVPALVSFLTGTESAVTPVKLEPSPEKDDG